MDEDLQAGIVKKMKMAKASQDEMDRALELKRLCPGLMRVVFGFQVLVDNVCDPSSETLDWKPELLALREKI